jgi:hypothetical protein
MCKLDIIVKDKDEDIETRARTVRLSLSFSRSIDNYKQAKII